MLRFGLGAFGRSFDNLNFALCLHLDSNSDRTLRLMLSFSFKMWYFSATHNLQCLPPGLYEGAFSFISQQQCAALRRQAEPH